jgi:hypothetical protein
VSDSNQQDGGAYSTTKHVESTPTTQKQASPLPWVIAGVCGALLLSIIVTNILICATVLSKRQHKTPAQGSSETGSGRQSSTCGESSTYLTCGQSSTYIYDYIAPEGMENNPEYGGSIGREAQFNIDNNPSYRTSIKVPTTSNEKRFYVEKNPSYRSSERGNKAHGSNFDIEDNPSYKATHL